MQPYRQQMRQLLKGWLTILLARCNTGSKSDDMGSSCGQGSTPDSCLELWTFVFAPPKDFPWETNSWCCKELTYCTCCLQLEELDKKLEDLKQQTTPKNRYVGLKFSMFSVASRLFWVSVQLVCFFMNLVVLFLIGVFCKAAGQCQ
jgi:hypothetical protein